LNCPECGRRHRQAAASDRCLADAGRATQSYVVSAAEIDRADVVAERLRYEAMKAYRRNVFGTDDDERPAEA